MATSITNTSVTTDNLTIDTDTLHVDSANNRVGIGTATPSVDLEILDASSRIKQVNSSGHQVNYGLWDGANYRIEGDTNRPIMITSYNTSTSGGIKMGISGGNHLQIVNGGYVTKPNQPSFMVYGAWSYASSTYIWKGFATVDHNIGSHWNNSIGRFTAPVAGRYMIYATAHHSTANTYHLWTFLKNGSLAGGNWVQSRDVNGGDHTTSKTQVWNLAAGDYLEVASNATYSNAYLGGYVTVGGYLVG